jgi:enamine deaminase RidA (YjgF/YER057c/UK114 family)
VHRIVNPEGLAPPSGFSHAVVAGSTIYIAGQTGHDRAGNIAGGLVEQFDKACANVVIALEAAGGAVEHLVSMFIYVTDGDAYKAALSEIGAVYRNHFGKHYPAIAWFEVTALFDPASKVELVCTAVTDTGRGQ